MNQTMIYDYLGLDTDPLYLTLKNLKSGKEINFGNYIIVLNKSGIYEIISDDFHDGFNNIENCYKYLLKLIGG